MTDPTLAPPAPAAPRCLTVADLRVGDVLSWTPPNRHCHEGTAVVVERSDGTLAALDTYWASDRYALSASQVATATVEWNLDDFEVTRAERHWERFAPQDRRVITAQNGLRKTFYVRTGARPDTETIVANAQAAVDKARRDVESAQWRLDGALRDLAEAQGLQ